MKPINFVEKPKSQKNIKYNKEIIYYILPGLILLLYMFFDYYSDISYIKKLEYNTVMYSQENLDNISEENLEISNKIDLISKQGNFFKELGENKEMKSKFLNLYNTCLLLGDENTFIEELYSEGNTLIIKGVSTNQSSINKYYETLKDKHEPSLTLNKIENINSYYKFEIGGTL